MNLISSACLPSKSHLARQAEELSEEEKKRLGHAAPVQGSVAPAISILLHLQQHLDRHVQRVLRLSRQAEGDETVHLFLDDMESSRPSREERDGTEPAPLEDRYPRRGAVHADTHDEIKHKQLRPMLAP